MANPFGPDMTLFKPKPSDYFAVGNPAVPQVKGPEPFSFVPQNNPYRSVVNAQTRLLLSGQSIPQPDKPGFSSLLFKALDILDRPRNAIMTGVRHATDGVGFASGAWKGFTGQEKTYGSDFLPEAHSTVGKIARGIGGFALDVVADPLTYATMGAGKLGETALMGGARAAESLSVASKLRGALGVAEGAHITPEMVKGLVSGAEAALPGAEKVVSTASRAASQSRNFFLPGVKDVAQGQVDQLTSFLGKGSIGEVSPEALGKLGTRITDVTSPAYLTSQERTALEAAGKRTKAAQQQYIVHSTTRSGGVPGEGANLSASVINSHNTKTFGPYGLVYPMEGSRSRIGGMALGDGASYMEGGVRKFPGGSTNLLPEHLPYGGIGYNEIGYTADKPIGIFIRKAFKGKVDQELLDFAKANNLPVLRVSDNGNMVWKTVTGADVLDAARPGIKPITKDYPKYLETINKLRDRGILSAGHLPVVDDLLKLNPEQLIKLDMVTAADKSLTFEQAMHKVTNDTIRDAVKLSAFDRLPVELAHLEPRQKAVAAQLFDLFGADSGLDVGTAATRIADNAGVRTGVSKGLDKLGVNLDSLGKAKSELAKTTTHVELTRGLAADFEKETGRYFLKFAGKPIVDLTPVKNFVMDKAVVPAYNKIPLVKQIVDTTGMLFLPHYIKWSEAVKKGIGPSLKTFEKDLTGTLRSESAMPHLMVNNSVTTLGKEFVENQKLNQHLGYYIEAQMANNMLPDLEKAMAAGTGREVDLLAAQEAIKYWDEIAPTFTPEELATLKRGHIAYSEKAKDLYQIDKAIGREYDPVEDYYHHLYKQDDKVVREHLRSVLPQRERIRKSLSTGLEGADKERRFLTMAYAKKIGLTPIDDAVTSMAVRELKTQRARYHHELVDKLLNLPEIVSNKANGDYVRLGDVIPALNGKFVHPEVARHLKRIDYLFFTDDGYNDLFRHIRGITNLVKAAQVGYNPNFTLRNVIGEGVMNLIAGVGLDAHNVAYKALNGSNEVVKVAEGSVPIQQLVREFQADGLWYSGVTRGNLAQTLPELAMEEGRVLAGGKRSQINVTHTYKVANTNVTMLNPNVLRETSDWVDKVYRMAHYIDRRVKGFGREAAAEDVRKFHVDYQDLTPSEKHVWRTVVPYYTYFRKNLPIQLRILMEQPGYQTAISKLVNNASHALGDPELSKYATENLALPLYTQDNGDVVTLNWNLPIIDIGRIKTNFRENLQEQLGSITPLLRVPFEIATNRTLSVDRPIEKYQGERVPMFEHLKNSPKLGAKLKYAMDQFGGSLVNVPASSVGRFSDYEQAIPDRPLQVPIFQSLLPIQRPSTAREAELYRYRDKLLAAIQGAEGSGQTIPALRDWGIK